MGIVAKKKFGQNFLIDRHILHQIVEVSDVTKDDIVLEIGPGTGNLTELLLDKANAVYAFEIDQDLIPHLEKRFRKYENFHLFNTDFLEFDLSYFKDFKDLVIVSNLPYYITSPIIFRILESDLHFKKLTFMMQEEVALRLTAKSGTRDFGLLNVFCNTFASVHMRFRVPPSSFTPSPSVYSSVVTFRPKASLFNKELFNEFLKLLFTNKRKTLHNNLKGFFTHLELKAIFSVLNLDEKVRAEELSYELIYELFKIYSGIERIKSPAKINLFLNVLNKVADYHHLESLVMPISLYDEISIFPSNKSHYFSSVPIDNDVMLKTRDLYVNTFNITEHFTICLDKNIPIAAGLGGASSDSSSLLLLLNSYFKQNYDLVPLTEELGSDNAFFLDPRPAILRDRGTDITYLEELPEFSITIFTPPLTLKTELVYRKFDELGTKPLNTTILQVLNSLKSGDYSLLDNNLLPAAVAVEPCLEHYLNLFKERNMPFYLTGSGPTFFFFNLNTKDKAFLDTLEGFLYDV